MKEKKVQIEKMLNAGLKCLKKYLDIPSVIENGRPSFIKSGWEQFHVGLRYDGLSEKNLDNTIDTAMKSLVYRLNYRNRFYRHGRLGIPRKKLAVMFGNLQLPHNIVGQVGDYRGTAMRMCHSYDIEFDYSIMRFDVLVKFVNRSELQVN